MEKSAEAELAATDQADTDRAGSGDNDGAVRTTMGTETRGHSVADEVNGCERMRNLLESRCGAPAPETNKTDPCVHQREILPPQPACSAAAVYARMIDRHALSMPSRVVAGPEPPSLTTVPYSSSIRARQRLPPPSTPRYKAPCVIVLFHRGELGSGSMGGLRQCSSLGNWF